LTGENDKYNDSKAVHLYSAFSDISLSAKYYKIASALTHDLPDTFPVGEGLLGQQRGIGSDAVHDAQVKGFFNLGQVSTVEKKLHHALLPFFSCDLILNQNSHVIR